jgi:hypothetical protein
VTRARDARRPSALFGQDEIAGLGAADIRDLQLAPFLFSRRAQPEHVALAVDDAEHQLAALQQLLHRMRDVAVALGFGAGEHTVADAERAPAALSPAPDARLGRIRLPALGNAQALPPSSTSTIRSTVTLARPPIA